MKNFIIITFALFTWSNANTQDLHWLNPLPQGNDLNCVRFVNEITGYAAGAAGTIMKTTDGGLTWDLLHSGTTADIHSVFFTDENTGFVIGSIRHYGYILKTDDGGSTWAAQTFGHLIPLTICFISHDTGFAGSNSDTDGEELQRTTDGGITWIPLELGIAGEVDHISSFFFTNEQTGYAVGNTLLKTGDGGISWTNMNNASGESVFFTDSITGYIAGGDGNIMKTIDGGASWTVLNTDTTYDLHSIIFTSANTGFAIGGRWDVANGIILTTQDTGATWTKVALDDVPELFSVCFTGTNTGLAVGRNGVIAKTGNGGTDWDCISEKTISKSLNSTFFLNASTGYAVGDGGTIIKTADGGRSWTIQSSGTSLSLKSVCFTDEYNGNIAGDSGCFLKTTNGGNTWAFQSLGDSVTFTAVDFPTQDTGYAIGNNMVFSTIDGGVHWISKVLLEPLIFSWLSSMYFVNKDTGFVIGNKWSMQGITGYIFKTTNGGTDWTGCGGRGSCQLYSVFFLDAYTGYVGGYWGQDWNSNNHTHFINITTDGGSTWTESVVDFTPRDIYFTSADTGYIIGEDDTAHCDVVQMTTDGGLTWSDNLFISQNYLNSVYFPDPSTGYIVGGEGTIVKITSSGGNPFGINDPSAIAQSIKIFPNPFSSSTVIEYEIENTATVNISAYNHLGQRVAELLYERQGAGKHTVAWNAGGLPEGIYYCRLQVGNDIGTGKLILMR